jgi:peptide subunit release factor 1 (eRF1)
MKLILIYNNVEKEYKSLREINKVLPDIDYHTLRQIYLQCSNIESKSKSKKLQSRNQELFNKIKIYDKKPSLNNLQLLASS